MTAPATATVNLSDLPPHLIKSHILNRLNGDDLASAASTSTTLRRLVSSSSSSSLWSAICHSTWPSTTSPRLSNLISTFPNGGARAFFSHAFPVLSTTTTTTNHQKSPPPTELISAIDIHHNTDLIFSKIEVTEAVSDWFRCSPFRIDLLDPKDVVLTSINHPIDDESVKNLFEKLKLSWILIDPIGGRAVNISSQNPVDIERHWLTGEVEVRYATVIGEEVECRIVVKCAGSEEGGKKKKQKMMQVKEVGLEMEDLDGRGLKGEGSLVFLHRALVEMEGKKGIGGKCRVQVAKRRYNRFLEMRRERKERRERVEKALDLFCLGFGIGVSTFLALWCFLSCT